MQVTLRVCALVIATLFSTLTAAQIENEREKLLASDAAEDDRFAQAVAIDGNTMVIAGPLVSLGAETPGGAYIFQLGFGGAAGWGQVKRLTPSDVDDADGFGASVAVDGNLAVVGTFRADGATTRSGAVYVFERNAGGANAWGEVRKIFPADGLTNDFFGASVSINGNQVAVGASEHDAEAANAGAAYLFDRNQGGADNWGLVKKFAADDIVAADNFGWRVAVGVGQFAVSALGQDAAGSESGAVYLFGEDQGGIGNWGQVEKLVGSATEADAKFGSALAISNDSLVVGAPGESAGDFFGQPFANAGAGYLFERNLGGIDNWGEAARLVADDADGIDFAGASVAIDDDYVIVGADGADLNGIRSGAAYVYRRNEGGPDNWGQIRTLLPSDQEASTLFGASVGVSNFTAVVGAPSDSEAADFAGAAYTFSVDNVVSYSVGGTATGLVAGDPVTLDINGDEQLQIDQNGAFTFIGELADGRAYNVSIAANPQFQTCTISNGSGQISAGPVTNIALDCITNTYRVGGPVSTPPRGQLPLADVEFEVQNNGGDTSTIGPGALSFLFPTGLPEGTTYSVTISRQPVAWTCSINNGSGVVGSADVVSVEFVCTEKTYSLGGSLSDLAEGRMLTLQNSGGDDLTLSEDGAFAFETRLPFGEFYSVAVATQPADQNCIVSSGASDTIEADVSNVQVVCGRPQINPQVLLDEASIFAAEGMADDRFGVAVAVSGDTAVVGSNPVSEGFAYIYQRDPLDPSHWNQVIQLVPSGVTTNGPASARFGTSVAIDGDTVVVGAPNDSESAVFSGAVFIFERNMGGSDNWGEAIKIDADDGGADERFGAAVALDGDSLAVGAEGVMPYGAAYVFERNEGGQGSWGLAKKIQPADVGERFFGRSLDIAGDVLAVGRETDEEFGIASGAVYLYERNLTGAEQWGLREKIFADDAEAFARFGVGLAVSEDTLVVGASGGGDPLGPRTGSAYVFGRNQGGADSWDQVVELLAGDGQENDLFGRHLAVNQRYISVTSEANAAYVFEAINGTWREQFKLQGGGAVLDDFFGRDLGMSGGTVIVGAINDDTNGQDSGTAYFFSLPADEMPADGLFSDGFESGGG